MIGRRLVERVPGRYGEESNGSNGGRRGAGGLHPPIDRSAVFGSLSEHDQTDDQIHHQIHYRRTAGTGRGGPFRRPAHEPEATKAGDVARRRVDGDPASPVRCGRIE